MVVKTLILVRPSYAIIAENMEDIRSSCSIQFYLFSYNTGGILATVNRV